MASRNKLSTITVVRWYEIVKLLELSESKFTEWSVGFFESMKDARAHARKKLRSLAYVPWEKLPDYRDGFRKTDYFYTIIPREIALDKNSATSGKVLSRSASLNSRTRKSSHMKRKTTR